MTPIILIVLIVSAVMLWTSLSPRFRSHGGKRCSRCWRAVSQLQPYIDGRREFWVCAMCAAEMEFANATHLDVPLKPPWR